MTESIHHRTSAVVAVEAPQAIPATALTQLQRPAHLEVAAAAAEVEASEDLAEAAEELVGLGAKPTPQAAEELVGLGG